ncbi:MAG: hypothetical protein ACJAZX_000997 [Rickettsiales bacterium]|jgi:hypothetical protein
MDIRQSIICKFDFLMVVFATSSLRFVEREQDLQR